MPAAKAGTHLKMPKYDEKSVHDQIAKGSAFEIGIQN